MKTKIEVYNLIKKLEKSKANEVGSVEKAHKTGMIDALRIVLELRELHNTYK